jgi:hypothetical protein
MPTFGTERGSKPRFKVYLYDDTVFVCKDEPRFDKLGEQPVLAYTPINGRDIGSEHVTPAQYVKAVVKVLPREG